VSFLPRLSHGAYAQMPLESISAKQYQSMSSQLKQLTNGNLNLTEKEMVIEKFCDGDACSI
jgi:hypothetical protein